MIVSCKVDRITMAWEREREPCPLRPQRLQWGQSAVLRSLKVCIPHNHTGPRAQVCVKDSKPQWGSWRELDHPSGHSAPGAALSLPADGLKVSRD